MKMSEIAIQIKDLTVSYQYQKPVLWDIDLEIKKGSFTAILGPNGAGKSTLIKTIIELIPKLSGEILFFGKPYKHLQKKIVYVPQRNEAYWNFPTTVLDIVLMGRYGHLGWFKRPTEQDKNIAKQALKEVDMLSFQNRQISELSGGQQQRVFLARSLAQQGEIYLLDEPLQGIDIQTEKKIISILQKLKKEGKTIIAIHHDLTTVEQYFDHIILLNLYKIASGETIKCFTLDNINKTFRNTSKGRKITKIL
ncbi:metal ABC transporter ATP-binding protein ['Crotalaria aegyptiaca' phytoplasma]|uniref:Metal ABC transporter ATP-binding protein n=1 Tax=Candidatus Phytoplasma crotalariae TaxID=2982627 RepID=A0ABT9D2L2_9MOLU|nr:metal ABC transporter ATP-binding protein ['Crotalaria aegyptiaca' phytoplasma]MDO8059260.1 metal ABC transporter ATP-binding protein ['Crotalaria aegyptiaca' phytoplasma]